MDCSAQNSPTNEENIPEEVGDELSLLEIVQQEFQNVANGGLRGPEPNPGHVLPLPLVPVAPYISGRDTPRDEVATPKTPFSIDPTNPLNWEDTGNRPMGDTDEETVVVEFSPPQGSPVVQ